MSFAKKSLGQHFLRSKSALANIVESARLSPQDTVLEVGPGEGVLTELLLQKAGRVIAVEKDDRLIPVLEQKFASYIASGKLKLIHADILTLSPTNYLLPTTNYKVVANLPYYITGQFLRKFLESDCQPSAMILLLQKEVAKRIVAADSQESILSISVKVYGTPRYIGTIKAGSFSPPPNVDSAVIAIENISKSFFIDGLVKPSKITRSDLVRNERDFFTLLKKGFAHPRKLLSGNLQIESSFLKKCGVAEKARAENLLIADWKRLFTLCRSQTPTKWMCGVVL